MSLRSESERMRSVRIVHGYGGLRREWQARWSLHFTEFIRLPTILAGWRATYAPMASDLDDREDAAVQAEGGAAWTTRLMGPPVAWMPVRPRMLMCCVSMWHAKASIRSSYTEA